MAVMRASPVQQGVWNLRVLITGITGFSGSHLAEYLVALDGGVEVFGTYRIRSRMDNIAHLQGHIHLVECELKDSHSVNALIDQVRPDYLFHLAAQSFVPTSWNAPRDTLINNILAEINLFEAIRLHALTPRIQIAGSSEEYGLVHPEETPINESRPLRPLSPYGVSKVTQDLLGYQYYQSYGLDIVRTRTFNHEGPRRGDAFVLSNFAKQIAAIENGRQPPVLAVGNLDAQRDFTDVRDVVKAYKLALDLGAPGEVYNIGSGSVWRIGDALDQLLRLSPVQIKVEPDPGRLRPSDVPLLHCDASKFMAKTGWRPEIPFSQTLADLLHYWRSMQAGR